ncbi:MAG: molybdopterin adenylyltransferase [Atribacterota bacterium]|jgi:molybdenum cofactor synthesis domain-containing protein|nr:molybdopterin adenylyltransferase [Atribacterota bacterium]MDD4895742.1 molybdopterin adenylyltransferase [Atribacterota bacterium]MDD5636763.1 molybdopterin adenylyltransferase [Atribacterota bacterium]
MIKVAIITVSDKGAQGQREDISGKTIENLLKKVKAQVVWYTIVPDELGVIKTTLIEAIEMYDADLVLTTGGTGLAQRDVTPEATRAVIEKSVPGISEIIRMESFKKTPHAILSRAIAGIRGKSIIINLPGSPKGVRESLNVILEALPHGIALLKGEAIECGNE